MNSVIQTLNFWGERALQLAWPMLWQSSLLIAVLFALNWVLRQKLRAAVCYALWLVVLVKLLLPPSLALPTGLGWWLRPSTSVSAKAPALSPIVTYGPNRSATLGAPTLPLPGPVGRTPMTAAAWGLVGSSTISFVLLAWMLARWRYVASQAQRGTVAPESMGATIKGLRVMGKLRPTGSSAADRAPNVSCRMRIVPASGAAASGVD